MGAKQLFTLRDRNENRELAETWATIANHAMANAVSILKGGNVPNIIPSLDGILAVGRNRGLSPNDWQKVRKYADQLEKANSRR